MNSGKVKFNIGYYLVIYGLITIILLSVFYIPEANVTNDIDATVLHLDMRGLDIDTEIASNLKNIKGGINLTVIEDRAFDGCPVETVRVVDD